MMRTISRCTECKKQLYGVMGRGGQIIYYDKLEDRKEHTHKGDWKVEVVEEKVADQYPTQTTSFGATHR